MSKNKRIPLPQYDLAKIFENKPKDLKEDSFGDERKDIKWLKVKRFKLLPFLNKKVKIQGKIKKFSTNILHRVPHALLNSVIIEDEIRLTHLWIETEELRLFLLHDVITFEGIIEFYYKNDHFFNLGIKDIKNMKLKKEGK